MEMVVARKGVKYEFRFKIDLIVWKSSDKVLIFISHYSLK